MTLAVGKCPRDHAQTARNFRRSLRNAAAGALQFETGGGQQIRSTVVAASLTDALKELHQLQRRLGQHLRHYRGTPGRAWCLWLAAQLGVTDGPSRARAISCPCHGIRAVNVRNSRISYSTSLGASGRSGKYITQGLLTGLARLDSRRLSLRSEGQFVPARLVEEQQVEEAFPRGWGQIKMTEVVSVATNHQRLAELTSRSTSCRRRWPRFRGPSVPSSKLSKLVRPAGAAGAPPTLSVVHSTGLTYGEFYFDPPLEGRRKRLKRLVGSLHLEPASRPRQRHFDMERIPDRYKLDPGQWDEVITEEEQEAAPVFNTIP